MSLRTLVQAKVAYYRTRRDRMLAKPYGRYPESGPGVSDHRTPLSYLLWLAGGLRRSIALAGLLGVVQMLGQALVPGAIGAAIEEGVVGRDGRSLLVWGGAVFLLALVQAIAGMLRDRCALTSSLGAQYKTIQLIARQVCKLGARLPERMSRGEVISMGLVDVASIRTALGEVLARGLGAIVAIVAVAAIMLHQSKQLGLIVIIGVSLITWVIGALSRPLHGRQNRLREQQAELANCGGDLAGGLRVLRGIGGEETFVEQYREQSQRVRRAAVEVARVVAWYDAAKVLLPGVVAVCVVAFGARFALEGQFGVGQLVAFYGYTVFLANPVRRVIHVVETITKAHVAARRVARLLRLESFAPEGMMLPGSPQMSEAIVDPASGVMVRQGSVTAVVCEGADDTARLAARFGGYVPSDVRYRASLLRELSCEEVRRHILVSDNNALLFSGPLRVELDPTGVADSGALERAVDAAGARDIIDALPERFDTTIAETGREFSGGQQQRLRLVRALMYNPDVLILVEPTNAVDAHTEARIAAGVRKFRMGRTTMVFATSPLILETADKVFFIKGLNVADVGSHSELLTNESYRSCVLRRGSTA